MTHITSHNIEPTFGEQHPVIVLILLGLTFAFACRVAIINSVVNDWNAKLQKYIDQHVYANCVSAEYEQKLLESFIYPDYRDYLLGLKKWHIHHFIKDEKLVDDVEGFTSEIYKGI